MRAGSDAGCFSLLLLQESFHRSAAADSSKVDCCSDSPNAGGSLITLPLVKNVLLPEPDDRFIIGLHWFHGNAAGDDAVGGL